MDNKIRVLMCGSDIEHAKGGMVSVIKNYLNYTGWNDIELTYIPTHRGGTNIQKLRIFMKGYKKIKTVLKNGEVDLVHLHMSERGSFYRKAKIVRLCKICGIPVIIHHHGADFLDTIEAMRPEKKRKVREILELADCNFVLSKDYLRKIRYFAMNGVFEVLPNAVNVVGVSAEKEKNYITTLGKLGERKGTYDLLKAIKILDSQLKPEIKFCLCGDGDVEAVRKEIAQNHLQNRIAHLGWTDGEQKRELLAKTMIHVLPSYREGLPMSILETMGMGIVNIASNVNAIPEVITDHENGLLIEPGEPEKLATAIRELAEDSQLRENMGEKARALVEKEYILRVHMRKIEEYYKSMARRKSPVCGEEKKERSFWKVLLSVILVLAVSAAGIVAVNVKQNKEFVETFYHVKSPKIGSGFRVAMLSDLHNKEYGKDNSILVERIKKLKPDIIAIAGDMVWYKKPDTKTAVTLCRQLTEIAPVYYSLGNHEGVMIYDQQIPLDSELTEAGVHVLYNNSEEIEINGNQILVGAVATSPEIYEEYSAEFVEEYEKADCFKLMLAHYPSLFYECMEDAEIDLSLSGHFHGGIVRIPGAGGLIAIPEGLFPKYSEGMFERGDKGSLIVGRGLGDSNGIPRINNQPELVVIDIEHY